MINTLLSFYRGALEQGTSVETTLLEVFSHEQANTEVQIASGLNVFKAIYNNRQKQIFTDLGFILQCEIH